MPSTSSRSTPSEPTLRRPIPPRSSPASTAPRFRGRVSGNLLAADQLYFVVVYHLDSTTYYPLPTRAEYLTQGGECRSRLGYDAMRHLVVAQKF